MELSTFASQKEDLVRIASAILTAVALIATSSHVLARPAVAATPTPSGTPAATTTVAPTSSAASPTPVQDLGLEVTRASGLLSDDASVVWRNAGPGIGYRLSGQMFVVRVNRADPFCSKATADDRQTLEVAQTLPAGTTHASIPLPALTGGDAWFAYDVRLSLAAQDANGREVGAQGADGVSESVCTRAMATPSASNTITLPGTGSGIVERSANEVLLLATIVSLVVVGLGAATIGRMLGRR